MLSVHKSLLSIPEKNTDSLQSAAASGILEQHYLEASSYLPCSTPITIYIDVQAMPSWQHSKCLPLQKKKKKKKRQFN